MPNTSVKHFENFHLQNKQIELAKEIYIRLCSNNESFNAQDFKKTALYCAEVFYEKEPPAR